MRTIAGRAQEASCGSVGLGWYAIRTHRQAERWAAANLERQGYPTFLPLVAVLRPDRTLRSAQRLVETPLFPGYCFTAFSRTDPWLPVQSTFGVASIVGFPNPTPMRAGALEAVRSLQEAMRHLPRYRGSGWVAGAPCSLKGGALASMPGVVVGVDERRERVRVSVLFLGQLREVELAPGDLQPRIV